MANDHIADDRKKVRPIDANALLEYVERQTKQIPAKEYDNDGFYHYSGWNGACVMARCAIKDAPAVDAVEVVRCKDCKHWHEETGWCNQHSHFIGEKGEACHPWESNDWKMLNEDDFCSYGERKDNERT